MALLINLYTLAYSYIIINNNVDTHTHSSIIIHIIWKAILSFISYQFVYSNDCGGCAAALLNDEAAFRSTDAWW